MRKRLLLLGFIVVLLVAIPLSVFVAQRQQTTKSKAAPSTTLSFSPLTLSSTAGATLKFDIMMDPGTNQVSFVKLVINFDPTKLTKTGDGLKENTSVFQSVLEGPTYDETANPATATISLSVGADPTKVITTPTRIASISFKALAPTTDTNPTQITFNTAATQVLSIGATDAANENVLKLSSLSPASVIIAFAPAPTPAPVPATTAGLASTNILPKCSALNLDRTGTGTVPFSITFTANGSDSDGTIQSVAFDFGDGPVQTITQGGALGTNSVSVQISHTYNNPGTFKATTTLTDNKGGISDPSSCTQTITVAASTGGVSGGLAGGSLVGGTGVGSLGGQLITVTQIPQTTLPPTTKGGTPINLPPTGPQDLIFRLGGAAAALSILGALIFFSL